MFRVILLENKMSYFTSLQQLFFSVSYIYLLHHCRWKQLAAPVMIQLCDAVTNTLFYFLHITVVKALLHPLGLYKNSWGGGGIWHKRHWLYVFLVNISFECCFALKSMLVLFYHCQHWWLCLDLKMYLMCFTSYGHISNLRLKMPLCDQKRAGLTSSQYYSNMGRGIDYYRTSTGMMCFFSKAHQMILSNIFSN